MIRLSANTAKSAVLAVLIGLSLQSAAQCDFYNDISVSTSGYETGTGYSHRYVLVDDASDEILSINTTGTFSGLAGGDYRVYAVNYDGAQPGILAVGNSWSGVDTYDSDSDNCFDASAAYNGGAVTVCEEVCNGDDITVSTTGHYSGGSYTQTFVLVNASGTILASNTTGIFTDAEYTGNGAYSLYAVNSDEASVAAEIADLGAWADVAAMASPTTCTDILGPRIFGVQACCNAPTVAFNVVPDCGSNQFSIDVVVSDLGDAASVNVKEGASTYQSGVGTGTYNVGTYASGASATLYVEDAADASCATTSNPLTFTCLSLGTCDMAGGTTELINESFGSAPSGWVFGNWSTGTSGGSYPIPSGTGDYLYINDANTNETSDPTYVYSPSVDASAADSLSLDFEYTFREYSSIYDDLLAVEVYDGSSWNSVFSIGGSSQTDQQTWTSESIDVSAYKNASFQVRFKYLDDGGWCYWAAVDNVVVTQVAASSDPNITLATGSVTAYPQCTLNDWTYYAVDGSSPYVFAINWMPDNSLSSNNLNARDASTVALEVGSNCHAVTDLTPGAEMGTWTMARYWNVNFSAGGVSMDESVNVRFYYDSAEKSAIETQSSTFASSNTVVDEGFAWFKTTSGDFEPNVHVSAQQVSGVIGLTAAANSTENNVTYVQFNGLTSFSGGTGASGAGPIGAGGPLPIEMLDVEAIALHNVNEVLWETASEQNTDVHIVERSGDGLSFEPIGELAAAGHSIDARSYKFMDEAPLLRSYYRIRTIDLDGTESVSKVVYAEQQQTENQLIVEAWPNPTRNILNLRIDGASTHGSSIRITDVSGKPIFSSQVPAQAGVTQQSINLSEYAAGMYFLRVSTENEVVVKKIMKKH